MQATVRINTLDNVVTVIDRNVYRWGVTKYERSSVRHSSDDVTIFFQPCRMGSANKMAEEFDVANVSYLSYSLLF